MSIVLGIIFIVLSVILSWASGVNSSYHTREAAIMALGALLFMFAGIVGLLGGF